MWPSESTRVAFSRRILHSSESFSSDESVGRDSGAGRRPRPYAARLCKELTTIESPANQSKSDISSYFVLGAEDKSLAQGSQKLQSPSKSRLFHGATCRSAVGLSR